MFYQANINNPEIQALLIQSSDLRSYMNAMEILGDLWDQEDLAFFLYLEGLLMEIEEEIYFLRGNSLDDTPQEGDIPYN